MSSKVCSTRFGSGTSGHIITCNKIKCETFVLDSTGSQDIGERRTGDGLREAWCRELLN